MSVVWCKQSASVVRAWCERGVSSKETMCRMWGIGAKAECEERLRSWWVRGATVVWCGGGEGEREEQKQMVRACVEQRERRWRAWSERGVSVASRSERFCVYCTICPDSFSLF